MLVPIEILSLLRTQAVIKFTLNEKAVSVNSSDDTPLLWVLRDELKLMGTKYGCGLAQCGACTVVMNGQAIRSCVTPIAAIAGKSVKTIEGLEDKHPLQDAWVEHNVPQCGYCQCGQIMSAVALLENNPKPNEAEIKQAVAGNICRCGCYQRIHEAIADASAVDGESGKES